MNYTFWYEIFIQLQDPTLVPDCINDLVGKEFTFGVYIDKENVAYGSEFYKVGKIYKDRLTSVPDPITPSLSSKQLTLTSGEEVPFNIFHSSWSIYNTFEISKVWFTLIILVQDSVYLSENQEHFDSNSTPSSKRKEEEITNLIDLSSTSKKSCTRSIKIEKVQDVNKKRWSILLST